VDIFVAAHLIGWMFKAAMIRDIWISMALSLLFELMEYTFEFLQPNFIECWWDHWLLDFLLCNTGGIVVGHWIMAFFHSKEYNWVRGGRQQGRLLVECVGRGGGARL
jgi:phosphatidylserine synthase 2